MKKLLSICIPTYNRGQYLDTCLESIVDQIDNLISDSIEIVVVDNDSIDNTVEIVNKFINAGHNIEYVKNDSNIGLDGNITKAFELAQGKYVQVLGDDDFWVHGKISQLLKLLSTEEFGVVYLSPLGFKERRELNTMKADTNKFYIYKDGNDFLYSINIMSTFTSSNVINKNLVLAQGDFKLNRFLGTDVNLLNWIFTAALNSNYNVITKDFYIAAKEENNGGYKFFNVFGINFNIVLDYFEKQGMKSFVTERINYMLTALFFPKYLEKINGEAWAFNDKRDEILIFLSKYRNADTLNKIFLLSILKSPKRPGLNNYLKFIIKSYNSILFRTSGLLGMLRGKIYTKVLK